jgi:enoyl-CoA hydratase/3-hydroxyacyl-CoA dehydrogenase
MVDISNIKNFSVVGTGFMGYGIAHVALLAGFDKVIIHDINIDNLNHSAKQIEIGIRRCEELRKFTESMTTDDIMKRLHKELDLNKAVKEADFVVEAVPEIMEIKREIFKKLGEYTPRHTILATNTSTMSITKIGELSGKQDKVIGMHFIPPIIASRLIEVGKGNKTSDESIDIGVAVAQKLPCIDGERFIVRIEKESPGYILNRLLLGFSLYTTWIAEQAHEQGIPWEQLDADLIMKEDQMCVGEMFDFIGLDIGIQALRSFESSLSPDFAPPTFLKEMVERGDLGAKTGKGFYEWPKGERYFFEWMKEWRPKIDLSKKAGLLDFETFFAVELNEGCRLLEEGVVSGYKVIDDVMSIGSRGQLPGPFTVGKRNYEKWSKILNELAEKSGKNYFKPCDLMKSGKFIKMRKEV